MKKYLSVWFILLAIVGFEYYALNFAPQLSLLSKLQKKGFIYTSFEVSPAPGRPVSLWLGWVGLGLMIIMNVYSMRKRITFMQGWGKLSDWLNFHVFCGLVGPTFILFHCNFKVRGIVGISFWSMMISFLSGIVGRYFYVQILKGKQYFESEADRHEAQLSKLLESKKTQTSDDEKRKYKQLALAHAGLHSEDADTLNPVAALMHVIAGDFRMAFKNPERAHSWPVATEYILAGYALNKRRSLFLQPFQKLMGYWHTFHFPFAMFMYIAALIHVIAALIFGV